MRGYACRRKEEIQKFLWFLWFFSFVCIFTTSFFFFFFRPCEHWLFFPFDSRLVPEKASGLCACIKDGGQEKERVGLQPVMEYLSLLSTDGSSIFSRGFASHPIVPCFLMDSLVTFWKVSSISKLQLNKYGSCCVIISEIISEISPRSLGSSSIIFLYFVLILSLAVRSCLLFCQRRCTGPYSAALRCDEF